MKVGFGIGFRGSFDKGKTEVEMGKFAGYKGAIVGLLRNGSAEGLYVRHNTKRLQGG